MPSFAALPTEIRMQILFLLSVGSQISASQVCKAWRSICHLKLRNPGFQDFDSVEPPFHIRVHKWLFDDSADCDAGCSTCVSKYDSNRGYYPTLESATSKSIYLIGNLDSSNTRIKSYERWVEKCWPSLPSSNFNVKGFYRTKLDPSFLESQRAISPADLPTSRLDALTFAVHYKARLTNSTSSVRSLSQLHTVTASTSLRQFMDQEWEKMLKSLRATGDQYITKVYRVRLSLDRTETGKPLLRLELDGEGGRIVDMYRMSACGNSANAEITSRQRASSVFRR